MKEIPISNGRWVAKVSDHRYEELSKYKWYIKYSRSTKYAVCNVKPHIMHHFILPPKKGFVNNHIDGDGLNNVDENLRYLTNSENIRKGHLLNNYGELGCKGVTFRRDKVNNPYQARAYLDGKIFQVGFFATQKEAEKARRQFLREKGVSDEFID